MDDRAKSGLAAQIAGALDWWREAGVDSDFRNEPVCWIAPPDAAEAGAEPRPAAAGAPGAAPPAPPPEPAIDRAALPGDPEAFAAWWLAEPSLDAGRLSGRVTPRGPVGAGLMVIVPEPERDDRERLLSGPQGRLLDAMLAAMGIAPEQAYVASALPRHTPMADWAALAAQGFGEVLAHHVKLARPRRLLVLGSNILPLLGNDPAHNPAVSRHFNHEGVTVPLLAGRSLAALLERPRWKAGLWQGWLDWIAREPVD